MFLSLLRFKNGNRKIYKKGNNKNYNNKNYKKLEIIVDDFWDTDGSDTDGDDYTYSPPSRFFFKTIENKKLKKITEMVLYKKKWAPWNEDGAFGI
jgi:hypothetical protein